MHYPNEDELEDYRIDAWEHEIAMGRRPEHDAWDDTVDGEADWDDEDEDDLDMTCADCGRTVCGCLASNYYRTLGLSPSYACALIAEPVFR